MTWCDCSSPSSSHPQHPQQCKYVSLTFLWQRQHVCAPNFQSYNFESSENCFCLLNYMVLWIFSVFGDSFITPFNYLLYIFHATIAHLNNLDYIHIIYLFYTAVFLILYFRVGLKPLFLRASWYSDLVNSNTVLLEELLYNLSLMESGSWLMI